MGKKRIHSKNKGVQFELKIKNELKDLFPEVETSRNVNRKRDAEKVDLVNTEPFNFQLKAQESGVNYFKLLSEMPDEENINIVLHKRNHKGVVAVLEYKDLLALIKTLLKDKI